MKKNMIKWLGTAINTLAYIAPEYTGRLGFRIFCRPVRRRIKPDEKKFLDSSKNLSFNYKGVRIKGYRWGIGSKKILLLHGWQSHSARWEQTVQALPVSKYSVYAFDAPGHGLSGGNFASVPFYGEVIQHFCKETGPFHTIAGHSLGAFSTLYVMSQSNQMETDRLIIMATPGEVKDFVYHFRHRLGLSDHALACIRKHFEKEIGRSFEYFSISRFAEYLEVPGLIIHDRADRFAPFRYAKLLNKKWENSKLIETNSLGHNLSSVEVVDTIVDFINIENGLTETARLESN